MAVSGDRVLQAVRNAARADVPVELGDFIAALQLKRMARRVDAVHDFQCCVVGEQGRHQAGIVSFKGAFQCREIEGFHDLILPVFILGCAGWRGRACAIAWKRRNIRAGGLPVSKKASKLKKSPPAPKQTPKPGPMTAAKPPGEEASPGIDVVVDGVHVDLDAKALPKAIEDKALSSGGYPYDKKLKGKKYKKELVPLQIELLKVQTWAQKTGAKIAIVFEGRDSAGKGGSIKAFTEHLNPRGARVVALPKPSDVERTQFYFQRYVAHLPAAGEIVFFDRSWYNRAVVEPVMGFCTPQETERFLRDVPVFERMLVENGIHLMKVWLEIGREMQITQLFQRRHDPLKRWKLSPIDYKGLPKWDDYTRAATAMLEQSHTDTAPWTVVRSNDKKRARLETMRLVLSQLDYDGKDPEVAIAPDPKIVADAPSFLKNGAQV